MRTAGLGNVHTERACLEKLHLDLDLRRRGEGGVIGKRPSPPSTPRLLPPSYRISTAQARISQPPPPASTKTGTTISKSSTKYACITAKAATYRLPSQSLPTPTRQRKNMLATGHWSAGRQTHYQEYTPLTNTKKKDKLTLTSLAFRFSSPLSIDAPSLTAFAFSRGVPPRPSRGATG